VLLAAFGLLLALPAGAGARGLITGFFDSAFAGSAGGARLSEAAELHAGAVRIGVTWPAIAPKRPKSAADPEDPAYHWEGLDAAVAQAHTRGFEVLLSVDQAANWANGKHRPKRYRQGSYKPNARAVGDFATAVARRYAPSVQYVQLFNEPNLDIYLSPQWVRRKKHLTPFAAVRYRAMLNAAYPGVHGAGVKLVTAGTAPYGDPGHRGRTRPLLFWKTVLRKKVRFDVLAHHPYSVGGPRVHALSHNDIALPDVHRLVTLVRKAVRGGRALPRARKRFWVTELSWDSRKPDPDGVPMKKLTRWVSDAFYVLWNQGIDHVLWFQVRDQPRGPSYAGSYQSGMFFRTGRPKPISRAFAFPFSCRRQGSTTRVWFKAPGPGPVSVQTTAGVTVKRVAPGADRVGTAVLRGTGPFRASQTDHRSPVCTP
jgi:hypothetical protein